MERICRKVHKTRQQQQKQSFETDNFQFQYKTRYVIWMGFEVNCRDLHMNASQTANAQNRLGLKDLCIVMQSGQIKNTWTIKLIDRNH